MSVVSDSVRPHRRRPTRLLSLGFSRQAYWSVLPFSSPVHESEKRKWSCSVLSNSSRPHGLQPTRLLHHGISQARALEWVAIAFSSINHSKTDFLLLFFFKCTFLICLLLNREVWKYLFGNFQKFLSVIFHICVPALGFVLSTCCLERLPSTMRTELEDGGVYKWRAFRWWS